MYRYCTTTAPLGACCMIMLFVGKNGCPCTMAHGKHELFLKFFSGKLPASGVLVKVARQGCSERAAYSASTLSYSLRACSSRLLEKAAMPGLRDLHQLQTACFCLARRQVYFLRASMDFCILGPNSSGHVQSTAASLFPGGFDGLLHIGARQCRYEPPSMFSHDCVSTTHRPPSVGSEANMPIPTAL